MAIHCNVDVVCTSLTVLMPGFEQETTWYHPQGIANLISLSFARKHLHIIYNIQDGNVFHLHKPDGSYHEFRDSDRGLYCLETEENKGAQATVFPQTTLTEGVTPNHTTLVTKVGDQKEVFTWRSVSDEL